jgi:hypothetical protein
LLEQSQRETYGQLVSLPRFEVCTFWVPSRSNNSRTNLLGTERNNDKRIVIEVPIFLNRWLGASWIAGCIISLTQFLSLGDAHFLRRKIFWTLYHVSWVETTHFLYTGQNTLSSYRRRRRSCGLVGRLALCSAKCILPVVLYRAFKYHRTQCSKCEKESRGRNVDCMNQALMTRKSSF